MENDDVKIIYEDENILAVNKPAKLLTHASKVISNPPAGEQFLVSPLAGYFQKEDNQTPISNVQKSKQFKNLKNHKEATLVDWLLKKYPKIKEVGDDPKLRPGIVHRLDKDTSGVMIVAKNQKSFEFLKEQFASRKIKKTYLALVEGKVALPNNKAKGKIETPIKRFSKIREAVTEYKVVKNFSIPEIKEARLQGVPKPSFKDYTLLEVYPKTGRTHQIRLHLKSIGHPVVCEKLYTKKQACLFGLTRHFLHAQSLELALPNNSRVKLEADLPKDLQAALKSLEQYGRK